MWAAGSGAHNEGMASPAGPHERDLEPSEAPCESEQRPTLTWPSWTVLCRVVDLCFWAGLIFVLGLVLALMFGSCAGPRGAALDVRAKAAGQALEDANRNFDEAAVRGATPEELAAYELARQAARAELIELLAERPSAIFGDTQGAIWTWLEMLLAGSVPAAGLYALRSRTRRRDLELRDEEILGFGSSLKDLAVHVRDLERGNQVGGNA